MTSRASLPRVLLLQHEAFVKTLGGRLLLAPLSTPAPRVLDIGTGCGIWAADFAVAHPNAEVIGIDNFPQSEVQAPPNCRFVSLDAGRTWDVLQGQKFDVIHTRLVPFHAAEIGIVLKRCYEHLAVGGWIEMQEVWQPLRTDEPPGAWEHGSKVIEWSRLRLDAAAKQGIDQSIARMLPAYLAEAGFVDVRTRDYKWPIGTWMEAEDMKELGRIHLELLQAGIAGLSKELLANLGMEEREIIEFLEQVSDELGAGKIYAAVGVVWARRPGSGELELGDDFHG